MEQKQYWMHRVVSHEAHIKLPLLERGLLATGWADIATLDAVSRIINGELDAVVREGYGVVKRNRYSLYNFINMKKGDIVVVPLWCEFSLFEIVDDNTLSIEELTTQDLSALKDWHSNSVTVDADGYLSTKNDKGKLSTLDVGFFRRVKPLKEWLAKTEYADATLHRKMKWQGTTLNITKDATTSVDNALAATEPIRFKSTLLSTIIQPTYDTIMQALNPQKFERLITWYLTAIGATDISPSTDKQQPGNIDMVATFEPIKTIIYVQAKYHTNQTDGYSVQEIIDFKGRDDTPNDEYLIGYWIISSALSFSDECIEQAKKSAVRLIAGVEFTDMILDAGLTNLESID